MSDQELTARLRRHRYNTWNDDLGPEPDKALAADLIERLTKKLKLLEKVEMYLKTSVPEKTGSYFICGEGGVKDGNGLPERLHVCPAYGVDWIMLYTRTDKTSGPEY